VLLSALAGLAVLFAGLAGSVPALSPPLPPEHLEAYLDAARAPSRGPGSDGSGRPVPGRAGRSGTST